MRDHGNKGKKHSEEWKRRISEAKEGSIPWNKGLTKETDIRVRLYGEKQKGRRSPNKGHPLTEEHKRNIGLANKGKIRTEEMNKRQSERAQTDPNYGMKGKKHSMETRADMCGEGNAFFGKNHTEETIRTLSLQRIGKYMGEDNPFFGKTHMETVRNLIGSIHRGKTLSEEHRKILSEVNTGKIHTEERNKKISEALIGRVFSKEWRRKISEARIGDKHPGWLGGISREPYMFDFNNELKKAIKERDNYSCVLCGGKENGKDIRLCIHHIDYNKKNSDITNLVALCFSCHTKTNYNREYWKSFFQKPVGLEGEVV